MGPDRGGPAIVADLTPREQEIAELVAEETLNNKAIALRLGISVCTVRTHVEKIGMKIPGPGRTKHRIIRWYHTRILHKS